MADFVFNVALGAEGANWAGGDIRTLLLAAKEADDAMRDHATVSAVLGAAGTTEFSTATSYARQALTGEARNIDNTNNRVDHDADDADYGNIGNGANETCVGIVVYRHVTNDSDSVPISKHDISFTTDGSQVIIQWATDGVWRAAG